MYVASLDKIEGRKMHEEGAHGVEIKHLLHEGVGAKRLQLRLFTIDVGGCTPLERHRHEHGVFMLQGEALVKGEDAKIVVKEGDVIFIPSWEEHQFRNVGKRRVRFLCKKETVE